MPDSSPLPSDLAVAFCKDCGHRVFVMAATIEGELVVYCPVSDMILNNDENINVEWFSRDELEKAHADSGR